LVELRSSSGELLYSTASTGDPIVLPYASLEAGTMLNISYLGLGLDALVYNLTEGVGLGGVIRVVNKDLSISVDSREASSVARAAVPVLSAQLKSFGFIAANASNMNAAPAVARLRLDEALSSVSGLTGRIYLVDASGRALAEPIVVSSGTVTSSSTSWTRPLEPGETVYIYFTGYCERGAASYLVLVLELVNSSSSPEVPETRAEQVVTLALGAP
jgi:hypothetical protein